MADVLPLVPMVRPGRGEPAPPETLTGADLAAVITRLEALSKKLDAIGSKPLLVDAAGLAKLFGCSKRHIARMRAANQLPEPVTLGDGNKVVWRVIDIEEFVAAGCDMTRFNQSKRRR